MKRGPKPFRPTPDERRRVKNWVAAGLTQAEMCLLIRRDDKGISVPTLEKHFRTELDTGAVEIKTVMANFGMATVLGKTDGLPEGVTPILHEASRANMWKFWMERRCGMVEKKEVEVGNKDGKPFVYVANPTDALL